MKSVKFLQRMVPYAPGDIAGFQDHHADRMIELGVAEAYRAPDATESPVTRDVKKQKLTLKAR